MKHIRLFAISLAISVLLLSFISCKNDLLNGATVKGQGITTGDLLNISITTDDNLQIFKTSNSNASRTILTDPFQFSHEDNDGNQAGDTLYFYLWGISQTETEQPPKLVDVTSTDGINGKVTIDLDCYNWELTLAATTNEVNFEGLTSYDDKVDAVKEEAVLISYANVDMTFTNNIKFTLTPKGLTKPGNVSLRLTLDNDWTILSGYTAVANIYDLKTGSAIRTTAEPSASVATTLYNKESPEAANHIDSFIKEAAWNNNAIPDSNYTHNNIAPGTYLFKVMFTKTGERRSYEWSQKIIILPGRTTEYIVPDTATETTDKSKKIVIPNLIGEKPVAPKDFKARYIEGSEDQEYGLYGVAFTWDQSEVDNESNFALEIIEIADDADPADIKAYYEKAADYKTQKAKLDAATNDDEKTVFTSATNLAFNDLEAAYNKLRTGKTYEYDYLNDVRSYVTEDQTVFYSESSTTGTQSSLFTESEYLEMKLTLGKRYLARLRSENLAGYSDKYTYVTIDDDTNKNKYELINRYRVTYHLQQGTWEYINEEGTKVESKLDEIRYWSQSKKENLTDYNTYNPIAPTGEEDAETGVIRATETTPCLYVGENSSKTYWIYWTKDLGGDKWVVSTTDDTPKPYDGFKNLDLYAIYQRDGEVIIYDDSKYDILSSYVSGFGKDYGEIKKSNTNEFKKGDNSSTTVKVKLPDGNEWKYDKITLTLSYAGRTYVAQEMKGASADNETEFTIELENIPTGYVYNCNITAFYKKTIVDYPFAIYIKN